MNKWKWIALMSAAWFAAGGLWCVSAYISGDASDVAIGGMFATIGAAFAARAWRYRVQAGTDGDGGS